MTVERCRWCLITTDPKWLLVPRTMGRMTMTCSSSMNWVAGGLSQWELRYPTETASLELEDLIKKLSMHSKRTSHTLLSKKNKTLQRSRKMNSRRHHLTNIIIYQVVCQTPQPANIELSWKVNKLTMKRLRSCSFLVNASILRRESLQMLRHRPLSRELTLRVRSSSFTWFIRVQTLTISPSILIISKLCNCIMSLRRIWS